MHYTIDDSFAVRIFHAGDDVPITFQPDYPNGDTFDSREEAEAWAVLAVASFEEGQPYPPNGKGLSGEPKLSAEETAELLAKAAPKG